VGGRVRGKGENEPRRRSWLVLVTPPAGPPIAWVPPPRSSYPSALSSIERGPHPSVEGRGTAGLELHGGERVRRRGGDGGGGGGVERKSDQHQQLMRLMIDSNSAPTLNNRARVLSV